MKTEEGREGERERGKDEVREKERGKERGREGGMKEEGRGKEGRRKREGERIGTVRTLVQSEEKRIFSFHIISDHIPVPGMGQSSTHQHQPLPRLPCSRVHPLQVMQ